MLRNRYEKRKVIKRSTVDLGHMKTQIRFEIPQRQKLAGGGWGDGWGAYKTTFAEKRDIDNAFFIRAAGTVETSNNEHTENKYFIIFKVRYDSNINTKMRIVDLAEKRAYRIRGITNAGSANRWLMLEVDGNNWEKI